MNSRAMNKWIRTKGENGNWKEKRSERSKMEKTSKFTGSRDRGTRENRQTSLKTLWNHCFGYFHEILFLDQELNLFETFLYKIDQQKQHFLSCRFGETWQWPMKTIGNSVSSPVPWKNWWNFPKQQSPTVLSFWKLFWQTTTVPFLTRSAHGTFLSQSKLVLGMILKGNHVMKDKRVRRSPS